MKTLKRSISLLTLLVLGCIVSPTQAQDFAVRNGVITLPSTVIRGNYDEVIAKQKFVLGIFHQLVERSPFELVDIRFATTEDGFLTGLVPIYTRRLKTSQNQHRVLVFTRDSEEMRTLLGGDEDAFLEMALRNEERAGDVWLMFRDLGGKETPIFIWLKTKSKLIRT